MKNNIKVIVMNRLTKEHVACDYDKLCELAFTFHVACVVDRGLSNEKHYKENICGILYDNYKVPFPIIITESLFVGYIDDFPYEVPCFPGYRFRKIQQIEDLCKEKFVHYKIYSVHEIK